jgi:ribosome-binding protein aMBF1 (putative translation factor)
MSLTHQDFSQIVLKKAQTVKTETVNKSQVPQHDPAKAFARKLDNEQIVLTKSSVIKNDIQKARHDKNLTQEQVDLQCGFPKGTIKKYENGTAIISSPELQKINKVLGLQLKKPKVSKSKADE